MISPEDPVVGQRVTITAVVSNVGTSDAEGRFNVKFLVDETQIDTQSVMLGIDSKSRKEVSTSWQAQPGPHKITVLADEPFNRVLESNEDNNCLTMSFSVPIHQASPELSNIKVALTRFEDRSGSGLINVGQGVADELITHLVQSGLRVLERSELEAVMQERGLNPAIPQDLVVAGQLLGADIIITGAVTKANVQQSSLNLGFFSASSASVEIAMSARLVSVYTSEILDAVSVEGSASGSTGFSVNFGELISSMQPATANVCSGGFRSNKSSYYIGETVILGYRNPGPSAGWYGVEIDTIGGAFVRTLDGAHFVNSGECGEWFWDQRGSQGAQLAPGLYIAKLWNGTSFIDTTSFQIRPGTGPIAPLSEITVGSGAFDETIIGKATNNALNTLVSQLISGLEKVAPAVIASRDESLASEGIAMRGMAMQGMAMPSREGQVAAILPDDRIAINIGAEEGIHKGDFFQVLSTANLVVDPSTGEILSYDQLGVKGEIVITEVRQKVSYGVRTSDFDLLIGDIVRLASS
jgi:hypothetical protein